MAAVPTPRSASPPSACSVPICVSPLASAMLRASSRTMTISVDMRTGWPLSSLKVKSAFRPGTAFANASADAASSSSRKPRSMPRAASRRLAAVPASWVKVSSSSAGVNIGRLSLRMRAAAAFKAFVSSGDGMLGFSLPIRSLSLFGMTLQYTLQTTFSQRYDVCQRSRIRRYMQSYWIYSGDLPSRPLRFTMDQRRVRTPCAPDALHSSSGS